MVCVIVIILKSSNHFFALSSLPGNQRQLGALFRCDIYAPFRAAKEKPAPRLVEECRSIFFSCCAFPAAAVRICVFEPLVNLTRSDRANNYTQLENNFFSRLTSRQLVGKLLKSAPSYHITDSVVSGCPAGTPARCEPTPSPVPNVGTGKVGAVFNCSLWSASQAAGG